MMICDCCNNVFDDDECNVEYEDYGKSINVCPHCKSDELSHAFHCTVCGEYQELGQTSPADNVCETCFDGAVTELKDYARTIFTGEKLNFVTELINEMGN